MVPSQGSYEFFESSWAIWLEICKYRDEYVRIIS